MSNDFFLDYASRLMRVTDGCRPDMHEPDEQDLKCRIVGDHLDNACGERIDERAICGGFQEYVVILERFREGHTTPIVTEKFNLACLIALARHNAHALLQSEPDIIALADMTDVQLLEYCGADAMRWAQAFCAIKKKCKWGAEHIDEGLMVGWFANAIETAAALRREAPAPAVDLTNHHNALKCPYCNPEGLTFARPDTVEAPKSDGVHIKYQSVLNRSDR